MSIWAEVWSRPGASSYGRVIDELPATSFGLHKGFNLVGDGNATVPDTFSRFDEILLLDPNTPANSVSSTIKYFSDESPSTPIFEWIPNLVLPSESKDDRTVEITGKDISSILGYARTEPYDWDGSDDWISKFPDWIWGNTDNNGFQNTDFESSGQTEKQQYHVHGSAGTYTITVPSFGTTVGIAPYEAGGRSSDVKAALEGLAGINEVVCTGHGNTQNDVMVIEFVDPMMDISQITIDDSSMTRAGCSFPPCHAPIISTLRNGAFDVSPWTRRQHPTTGNVTPLIHGITTSISVTDDPALGSGTQAIKLDLAQSKAGLQQIIDANPSSPVFGSFEVYSASTTDEFYVTIVNMEDSVIGITSPTTIPANTWTEISFSGIDLPADLPGGQIAICLQVDSGDAAPDDFYMKNPAIYEGLAATTVGDMLTLLYNDATSDHAPDRIVWDDAANPGTPYLTLDFSDSVDSNGNAWAHSDLRMRVWMRMSFLQVLQQMSRSWGYEWRVVANSVDDGTYQLQVYNPGTMKTDYTSSASPAIQGGGSDTIRRIVRFLPQTDFLVEGELRITSRDRNSDLETALGRIEASRLDRELPSQQALVEAAYEDAVDAIPNAASYSYTLVSPQDTPLVDYTLGDLLTIHDPPEVDDSARLMDVVGSFTPTVEEWTVDFVPATAAGS